MKMQNTNVATCPDFMTFEALTAVKMLMFEFYIVTLCRPVCRYKT
jgi:hypothetical protein